MSLKPYSFAFFQDGGPKAQDAGSVSAGLSLLYLLFEIDDVLYVIEEPAIDFCQGEDFFDGQLSPQRFGDVPKFIPAVGSQLSL